MAKTTNQPKTAPKTAKRTVKKGKKGGKPECSVCMEVYSQKRKNLGYKVCLGCGEKDAQAEVKRKSKRSAIAYNKGPYMYVTEGTSGKYIARK